MNDTAMRIAGRSIYRTPNRKSAFPMIPIRIDLGDLENCPTNLLPKRQH